MTTHREPSGVACLAPWKALSIRSNGDVSPDAQYEGVYGNINENSLSEILVSPSALQLKKEILADGFGAHCGSCQKKEATVGHSRRIYFDHTLTKDIDHRSFHVDTPSDILYLDLNLSNKCNLKCRMCNSISSTAWMVDERALQQNLSRTYHRPPEKKPSKLSLDKVLEVFADPRPFRNLKYLAFRGGEPLLEVENIKVLEKFVEWGFAKDITVDISTNGSVFSEQIQYLLSQFKQTDLYVSVEGAGSLYGYIRGGDKFSLQDLEKNIIQFRQIPNLTVMLAVTISIYNIFKLDELWNWFEGIYKPFDEIIMTNVVVRPEYLNFQILPQAMKIKALERLENSKILEGPHDTGKRLVGDSGKMLIRSSLTKDIFTTPRKKALIKQFVDFNSDLDKIRGTDIHAVVPELSDLFDAKMVSRMLRQESAVELEGQL